jgi:hypothetical protein
MLTRERRVLSRDECPGHVEYGEEEASLSIRLYNLGEREVHPDHLEATGSNPVERRSVGCCQPPGDAHGGRTDGSVGKTDRR